MVAGALHTLAPWAVRQKRNYLLLQFTQEGNHTHKGITGIFMTWQLKLCQQIPS
jgi:hypothetical protein